MNTYNKIFANLNLTQPLIFDIIILYNFPSDVLGRLFTGLVNIIEDQIKRNIFNKLNSGVAEFKASLSNNKFIEEVKKIKNKFESYISKALGALDNYGYEFNYKNVLEQEMATLKNNNRRRNLLENYEYDIDRSISSRNVADIKLNAFIKKILELYRAANNAIKGANANQDVTYTINSYITKTSVDFLETRDYITSRSGRLLQEIQNALILNLTNLRDYAVNYFDSCTNEFNGLLGSLNTQIKTTGERLNKMTKSTFTVIGQKYTEIGNSFISVKNSDKVTTVNKQMPIKSYIINYEKYEISANLSNISEHYNFDFSISYKYEDGLEIPSFVAKIESVITPHVIELLLYRKNSRCGRIGTRLLSTLNFNSLNMTLTYNSDNSDISLRTQKHFERYETEIRTYELIQLYEWVKVELQPNNYWYKIPIDKCPEKEGSTLIKAKVNDEVSSDYLQGQAYDIIWY